MLYSICQLLICIGFAADLVTIILGISRVRAKTRVLNINFRHLPLYWGHYFLFLRTRSRRMERAKLDCQVRFQSVRDDLK